MTPTLAPSRRARRRCLGAAVALVVAPWATRHTLAHGSFGPVQPALAAPALFLNDIHGQRVALTALLTGRVTALQLMFTGCSATCPIQGATFADVQQRLVGDEPRVRLLSVSIDPLGHDPKALRAWLAKFGAQTSRWSAALPGLKEVDVLLDFVRGRAPGADRHTAQAFVFDRQARLVYRTEDMPNPPELVRLLKQVAARA